MMNAPLLRRSIFVLLAAAVACKGDSSTAPTPRRPGGLTAVSPAQSGVVGTMLAAPVVVKVADAEGNPMGGVNVSWVAGSGSVSSATSETNANGIAAVRWILGTTAGVQQLTATVVDAPQVAELHLDATAVAGPSTGIVVRPQAVSLQPLDSVTFSAEVAPDRYGNAITTPVTWSSSDVYSAPVTSDGRVHAGRAGRSTIIATVGSVSAHATAEVAATWQAIASGRVHSCALDKLGYAFCWGQNDLAQLGVTGIDYDSIPMPVSGGRRYVSLIAGADHACGLTADHFAYCWGNNSSAQLGIGQITDPVTTPTAVAGGHLFTSLASSGVHTCGITTAGDAYCWGWEGEGELGNGVTGTYQGKPNASPVLGGMHYVAITAGSSHTCAITVAADGYCWGNDYEGQAGHGTAGDYQPVPVAVSGTPKLGAIAAGGAHSCAIDVNGGSWCWGSNEMGQIGDGTFDTRYLPVPVQAPIPLARISAGYRHSCALSADGQALCWGFNENGQLGDGTTARRASPDVVSTTLRFTALSAGWNHSCALTAAGQAYCWGDDHIGQLGNGTFGRQLTPALVLAP